jgi:hypothetical protein
MPKRTRAPGSLPLLLLLLAFFTAGAGEPYRPQIDPADFTHVITNPWFPLVPGTTATFLEKDLRETRENKITVTRDTKIVMGVRCVVVRDIVTLDGRIVEETYEWYAQDRQGAVWYFGEATREYKVGGRVSTLGSWEAGVNGALPGIAMPAQPRVGERYRQEYAANEAEDIGQIAALGETVTVPAGTFTGCVRTREWSMLESGTSKKWYARGVGLVRAESTDREVSTLLSITRR